MVCLHGNAVWPGVGAEMISSLNSQEFSVPSASAHTCATPPITQMMDFVVCTTYSQGVLCRDLLGKSVSMSIRLLYGRESYHKKHPKSKH